MTAAELIAWRQARGWSGSEAARQIGCARNSMRAYESGQAEIPRYIELACLAISHGLDRAPAAESAPSAQQ